jgi:ABC-type cobalamin transport system ATPase subunit
MPADHSPRSAAVLLSGALAHLDVIQPAALREPVRDILRAGVEMCVTSRSLLGKPIQHTIRLAQAVMDVAKSEERRDEADS